MTVFTHYTASEGDEWSAWDGGDIDGRSLKKRDRFCVEFNGVKVHSLKADDGREWDCVNGWRGVRCPECGRIDGHYDDCPAGITWFVSSQTVYADIPTPETVRIDSIERAQAHALRVWAGQSRDVKRAERIARIKRALAEQNLPTDGICYPE
jgi:hypothetical protein